MEFFFDWIMQLPPALIQSVWYGVLFIATISEGIPPLGFFVPGQTITLIAGILTHMELLSFPLVLGYAIVGIWIGGIFAYSIGKKFWLPFLQKYGKYVLISDTVLEKIQDIMVKHMSRGIIFSEFYTRTRGILPFIAGVFKVKFSKFLWLSLIWSILWGITFISAGYLVGESYTLIAEKIGGFITRGICLGIGIAILFRYFNSEYNFFRKGFSLLILGNILSVVLFSVIAQRLHQDKLSFTVLDTRIQNLLIKSPLVDHLVLRIDQIFNFWLIGGVGLLIIIYLYRNKLIYHLTVFVSSMLSAFIAFPAIKMLIQRARPESALLPLKDFSFPSGHATVSLVVCLLGRYVLQGQIQRPWVRYGFLVVMILCAMGIGTSRIFLHVHRFTDVFAGFLLGFFILVTNILVRKIFFKTHIEKRKVIRQHSTKSLIEILVQRGRKKRNKEIEI